MARNDAAIGVFARRVAGLVALYGRSTGEGTERLRRRVLIAGLRWYALELVAQVVGGPACRTHAWTARLARRNFDAALARLERELEDARRALELDVTS